METLMCLHSESAFSFWERTKTLAQNEIHLNCFKLVTEFLNCAHSPGIFSFDPRTWNVNFKTNWKVLASKFCWNQRFVLYLYTLQLCWGKSWEKRLKGSNYGSNWFGKDLNGRLRALVAVLRIKKHKWFWLLNLLWKPHKIVFPFSEGLESLCSE